MYPLRNDLISKQQKQRKPHVGVMSFDHSSAYQKIPHRTLRFARWRTTSGQSQGLWSFLVAMGIAFAALMT